MNSDNSAKWHLLTLKARPGDNLVGADKWLIPETFSQRINNESLRLLPLLGILAVLSEDIGEIASNTPGVLYVTTPAMIGGISGSWYLNLLLAWEYFLGNSDRFDGIVVNMSLGPPTGETRKFSFYEPINRAFHLAYRKGLVTVISAGNDGPKNDTMTRWAQVPWVISVAATDESGSNIQPWSSRGIPGHSTRHPTVAAPGFQSALSDAEGTSYSAPEIADIVNLLQAFFLRLIEFGGQPSTRLRKRWPRLIRQCLLQMARPMQCATYECGAGFVNLPLAIDFLCGLQLKQLRALLGPADWLTPNVLSLSQVNLQPSNLNNSQTSPWMRDLIGSQKLARIALDTTFEWTLPTFSVPVLLHCKNCLFLRNAGVFDKGKNFDSAAVQIGSAAFIETSILPHQQKARQFVVSRSGVPGSFPTISGALAETKEFDVVRVGSGVYEEELQLRSGVTIIGEDNAIIRSPSGGTAVFLTGCKDVALENLEIVAESDHAAAVRCVSSTNVVLKNCRVKSLKGNALLVFTSKRLEIVGGALSGGINGAYYAFVEQCDFSGAEIKAQQIGLLLYACSGLINGCKVRSDSSYAIFTVAPRASWQTATIIVATHPLGWYVLDTKDITPETARATAVAEFLFGLVIKESSLEGALVPIIATNFKAVMLDQCMLQPSNFGLAYSDKPLPIACPPYPDSFSELSSNITNSLNSLPVELSQLSSPFVENVWMDELGAA